MLACAARERCVGHRNLNGTSSALMYGYTQATIGHNVYNCVNYLCCFVFRNSPNGHCAYLSIGRQQCIFIPGTWILMHPCKQPVVPCIRWHTYPTSFVTRSAPDRLKNAYRYHCFEVQQTLLNSCFLMPQEAAVTAHITATACALTNSL